MPLDFGDAPDPTYPTLFASNGARHRLSGALRLGTDVDAETDGNPSADALGDDIDGSPDEDGVSIDSLTRGDSENVTVDASTIGLVNAWIDFNADGDWDDPDEQVLTDEAVGAGTNDLTVAVPLGASVGTTFARFRLDTNGALAPTGEALDGEVEDYEVLIVEPTPTSTGTPAPTETPTPTPTATVEPTPTTAPTVTPAPPLTPTPTRTPRFQLNPTPTPRPTLTPRPTRTPRPTVTPAPTVTPRPTRTPRFPR